MIDRYITESNIVEFVIKCILIVCTRLKCIHSLALIDLSNNVVNVDITIDASHKLYAFNYLLCATTQ